MSIVAYSDETFTDEMPDGEYHALYDPQKIKWGHQIGDSEEAALGSSGPSLKYDKSQNEKLSFELVIDCTGALDEPRIDLPDKLARLSKILYDYNGDSHRPNYLIIRWGAGLTFKCVLTCLNTSMTLFKPDGTPLKARVELEFVSCIDLQTLVHPGAVLTAPLLVSKEVKND